jgi:hypothetical protein
LPHFGQAFNLPPPLHVRLCIIYRKKVALFVHFCQMHRHICMIWVSASSFYEQQSSQTVSPQIGQAFSPQFGQAFNPPPPLNVRLSYPRWPNAWSFSFFYAQHASPLSMSNLQGIIICL